MKIGCTLPGILALAALLLPPAPGRAQDTRADQVVELLRAANQARAEDASEAKAWREEQARLRLLVQTLQDEAARYRARAAELRAEIARLKAARAEDTPVRQQLAARERLAEAQATRLQDALDALQAKTLPGVIPERAEGGLSPARARLEDAERRAGQVAVELASGAQDGRPLRVELLRAGGAAGWWCSLDGKQAGLARRADGQLRLDPPPKAEDAGVILEACRIAKGRAAPVLVNLPVKAVPR